MKKKNLFLIILILFVFLLLFFHRFFIYGELLFYGDVYWYFIPVRKIISEYIINFKIPLWLNSLNCGFPIFSAAQYGIFNPLQFIFYFLKEQELAYTLLVIISYIILYFSSYIYFKHKFKSIIISIFCSSLFSFFGFNLLSYLYVPLIVAISLLPLSFYCIEKYVNSLQKKYLCFIGLIISFQILNGHPQIPFINIIGLFFHTLILLFLKKEKINKYLYFYSALILVLLLAFGIAAIQILPLYQLSKYSVRAHTDLSHSIPLYPHSLISFVFYNFFGSDAENSFIGPPFGSGNELYTGILTIFFFIISIKNLNKKKSIKYYLFLFIFFLLIALGRFSPIYFIIKNIFIFKKFRAISRFVLLVNFYQIIISGYGLLFFLQSYKKRKIKFSVFNLFISLFLFLFLLFGLVVYFQKEYILQKSFIYLKEFS
ncbi:MAG TPA: hypothetical protein PLD27_11905, partial [bacterium]|nr:hypothetical protein [bacterium]